MSQHMFTFTFGSQTVITMLLTPAAQNMNATAFQYAGTRYIFWLPMKMEVSTTLQLILSKMVNPCLTMFCGRNSMGSDCIRHVGDYENCCNINTMFAVFLHVFSGGFCVQCDTKQGLSTRWHTFVM